MLLLWDLPCYFVLNPFSFQIYVFKPPMLLDRAPLKAALLKLYEWILSGILLNADPDSVGLGCSLGMCTSKNLSSDGRLWGPPSEWKGLGFGLLQIPVCKCSSNPCDLSLSFLILQMKTEITTRGLLLGLRGLMNVIAINSFSPNFQNPPHLDPSLRAWVVQWTAQAGNRSPVGAFCARLSWPDLLRLWSWGFWDSHPGHGPSRLLSLSHVTPNLIILLLEE